MATIAFALSRVNAARRHPQCGSHEAGDYASSSTTGKMSQAQDRKTMAVSRFDTYNVDRHNEHDFSPPPRSCVGPEAVRLYRTVSTVCGGTTPAFRASLQLLNALVEGEPQQRAPSESSTVTSSSTGRSRAP